jgi:hypothetical protein
MFAPLGLEHAATDAASAILFRAAVVHLPGAGPDDDPVPAPILPLVMMSSAPAGSALAMPPRDLLASAAMHLNSGEAADGTQVLSAESTAAMNHLEGGTLIPLEPKYGIHIPQVFIGDDGSGRSFYIHSGRAIRRAG